MAVRERFAPGRDSLGVPTWFYGHEPPNVFADHVAKYFRNAIREDVLLRVCRSGIVFLPGAAGTVQEVFQSACENYYTGPADVAPDGARRAPVLDRAAGLAAAERLAQGRAMAAHVHLVDDVDDVPGLLREP
jgi:hypothetical protein